MKSLNQYINEVSSGLLTRAHNAQLKRNGGVESNRSRKFARGAHAALDREMSLEDSVSGTERKYDYVDLGLPSGTMWATCNVGADKPEDEGLLFQWGRVDGYKYGDKDNKFRTHDQNEQDTGDGYIPQTTSGKVYRKNDILDPKDDAAHVNMGGKWRMPTYNEMIELRSNTTYDIKTINGVKGMMFTSNKNGNQLFMPFINGYWNKTYELTNGSFGVISSSQMDSALKNIAYKLYCYADGPVNIIGHYRSYAVPVRGVFKK